MPQGATDAQRTCFAIDAMAHDGKTLPLHPLSGLLACRTKRKAFHSKPIHGILPRESKYKTRMRSLPSALIGVHRRLQIISPEPSTRLTQQALTRTPWVR